VIQCSTFKEKWPTFLKEVLTARNPETSDMSCNILDNATRI